MQLLEANLFAYCANNPINMIDEDGFQFKAIFTKLPSLIKGVKIAGKYVYKYAAKGVSFVKNACGKIFKKGWAKSVPNKAYDIANKIKSKNGAPPKGYKGGSTFKNIPVKNGQRLPEGVNYKEYDINSFVKGQNRGTERIVIGDNGAVWYTNNHYHTFTRIK